MLSPKLSDICAIIPTRGDVPHAIAEIRETLPYGEVIVWDNSVREDLGAYGRYAAIELTDRPIIYFQDDDCLFEAHEELLSFYAHSGLLVANMQPERIDYEDTVLIGWGSLFARDLPAKAFERWWQVHPDRDSEEFRNVGADFVFPMLTPHRRVHLGVQSMPHAWNDDRTYKRLGYEGLKERYMEEARAVRDAGPGKPTDSERITVAGVDPPAPQDPSRRWPEDLP